jgi:phosphoglycerol transferase MdoB-like AlkP superfamily enzyme
MRFFSTMTLLLQLRFLYPFLFFCIVALGLTSAARMGMIIWQWPRVDDVEGLWFLLFQGVRFDLVTIGLLLVIPCLISVLAAAFKVWHQRWESVVRVYLAACFALLIFMELATPQFIDQFDLRPNILFVEYLKYPKEVLSMLLGGYKLSLLVAFFTVPISTWLVYKRLDHYKSSPMSHSLHGLWIMPVIIFTLALMIRSTLDHRPVNPSIVAFSQDLMVNDLALNSTYTVLYAIYESRRDENGEAVYGRMKDEEVFAQVKRTMHIPDGDFTSKELPTLHRQRAIRELERPPNLVIILEESLGASFVGSLGGFPLTPNLDILATEGIWFEQLYATGTRSVRGIEAVITGFTPTPARSVVKLNRSQHNFFTIAQLLGGRGYQTSFLYGGEAHFDNMRRFFVANGFNRIIDENDYENPDFVGSWGVSDEDLFDSAHKFFESYGDKPFFSLVFTSSNHSPFEFPNERNAVKYADYALGQFFAKAKVSNYWDNTLFLVVADHSARVRGADLVPIESFRIPALILGASIAPQRISRMASQIDLLPTILSIMGISSIHPAIGYDLLRTDINEIPGRAMMQYNATQAYIEEDQAVIFEREKKPKQYHYKNKTLVPAVAQSPKLLTKALAHSLWGTLSYSHSLYRLPEYIPTH